MKLIRVCQYNMNLASVCPYICICMFCVLLFKIQYAYLINDIIKETRIKHLNTTIDYYSIFQHLLNSTSVEPLKILSKSSL